MILDASAIISILIEEPGFREIAEKINKAGAVLVGAPTVFETAIVLERMGTPHGVIRLSEMLEALDIQVVSFGEEHYRSALTAFQRFGKGRHAARLNFGDCMSYAIADLTGLPLLFTGDDFSKTDIEAA